MINNQEKNEFKMSVIRSIENMNWMCLTKNEMKRSCELWSEAFKKFGSIVHLMSKNTD